MADQVALRGERLEKNAKRIDSLINYEITNRIEGSDSELVEELKKRVRMVRLYSYNHGSTKTVSNGQIFYAYVSQAGFLVPLFETLSTDKADPIKSLSWLNNGGPLFIKLSNISRHGDGEAASISAQGDIVNEQDFPEQDSLAKKNLFPPREPFELQISINVLKILRFVTPTNIERLRLTSGTASQAPPVTPMSVDSSALMASAITYAIKPEGKKKVDLIAKQQKNIRCATVYGSEEDPSRLLATTRATYNSKYLLNSLDEGMLEAITFHNVGSSKEHRIGHDFKFVEIGDVLKAVYPAMDTTTLADPFRMWLEVSPILNSSWDERITSNIVGTMHYAQQYMNMQATNPEDRITVYRAIEKAHATAISLVTTETSIEALLEQSQLPPHFVEGLTQQLTNVRANQAALKHKKLPWNPTGGGGGGGGRETERNAATDPLAAYCYWALKKQHSRCAKGPKCSKIFKSIDFSKLDPNKVAERIARLSDRFEGGSGSKRSGEENETGGDHKRQA